MLGAQPPVGAFQKSVTVAPIIEAVRLTGAPGAPLHGPPPPTTIVTSFDGPLVPAAFLARTRTKYVFAGTDVAWKPAAVEPVSKMRILLKPGAEPASITYEAG